MSLTSTLERTPPPLPGKTVDNTLPTIGGNLAVVPDSETSSGFSLTWDKGSDNQTAEENLKYLVYLSAQNNITGVTNAEANGTLLNPNEQDQIDINTYQVTGQNAETQYWATVILKDQAGNKAAYGVVTTTTEAAGSDGLDSKAGDEAALEALYTSLNSPALTGWGASMDLSNTIEGVTTATIGGELRVTEIDLQNKSLTGNIEITEWQNLKQMELCCVYQNSLNTSIPQELMDLALHSLKYLYVCRPDNFEDANNPIIEPYPHEQYLIGDGQVHPGKNKAGENNIITGTIPAPSNPANSKLEWFWLAFPDSDFTATDGVSDIDLTFYDQLNMVGFAIYHCNALSHEFPAGLTNMTNLDQFFIAGRNGGTENWLTGSVPSDFGNLTNLRYYNMANCDNLTFDLDAIDWSGMTKLNGASAYAVQYSGSFPPQIYDGTMPDMLTVTFEFPMGGSPGVQGALPAIDPSLSIKVHRFRNNSLTSLPASMWEDYGGIIQAEFTNNNLTTIGKKDLTLMYQLRYFWVGGNELHEDWPYLDWANHATITQGVEFNNNRYVFKHWLYVPPNAPNGETVLELWQDISGNDVSYGNQKPFGSQSNEVNGVIDFSSIVNHANNSYQWYKDGSPISGATSNVYDTQGQVGSYKLEVTNSLDASVGAGITITSTTITIE